MSFKTTGFSEGVLLPEELQVVQAVFKRIAAEGLLSKRPQEQQAFAAYVIKTYGRGLVEPERLYRFCAAAAKAQMWKPEDRKLARQKMVSVSDIKLPVCKVLIVEDDYTQASEVKSALERAGAIVLGPVANEEEAIALLDSDVPDLAVVDLNLGRGVTFSVASYIRHQSVPLCVVTGYSRDSLRRVPDELLDVLWLEKPVAPEELLAAAADSLKP